MGFNVGLSNAMGSIGDSSDSTTVWDSSLRMVRRHAITISIRLVRDRFPALVLPGEKLGKVKANNSNKPISEDVTFSATHINEAEGTVKRQVIVIFRSLRVLIMYVFAETT